MKTIVSYILCSSLVVSAFFSFLSSRAIHSVIRSVVVRNLLSKSFSSTTMLNNSSYPPYVGNSSGCSLHNCMKIIGGKRKIYF